MTPRSIRVAFLVFGLIWLSFGIAKLIHGETGMGVGNLALGVGWLLVAAYNSRQARVRNGERANG
jgi:TM2 domain-containing membrane protein YozV